MAQPVSATPIDPMTEPRQSETGLWNAVATTDADRESVIAFFEHVAAAEAWQPGDQLRAHTDRSTYFAVWDRDSPGTAVARVIGALQLVAPDEAGTLPSHLVWPELPTIDPSATVLHAAVLAVLPEYRGKDRGAAFWQLGCALWRHCVEQRVQTVWLEATPKMLRCYGLLGWPLVVQGELREHWGEPVYPCRLSIREVAGSLAERALTSTTYRRIFTAAIAPRAVGQDHLASSQVS